MSEQYGCPDCNYVEYIDKIPIQCPICGHTSMERLRWTKGGDGSHWEGGDEVHWDCRIAKLEKEIDRLKEDLAETQACLLERNIELDVERRSHRWIPVSERLPEDGEVVWLWDGNNLGMGYYLVLTRQFMDRDTPLRRIKPTHWMPLPNPPEVK